LVAPQLVGNKAKKIPRFVRLVGAVGIEPSLRTRSLIPVRVCVLESAITKSPPYYFLRIARITTYTSRVRMSNLRAHSFMVDPSRG
jgi:hypothetical protein